jgi:hypothetical protein
MTGWSGRRARRTPSRFLQYRLLDREMKSRVTARRDAARGHEPLPSGFGPSENRQSQVERVLGAVGGHRRHRGDERVSPLRRNGLQIEMDTPSAARAPAGTRRQRARTVRRTVGTDWPFRAGRAATAANVQRFGGQRRHEKEGTHRRRATRRRSLWLPSNEGASLN